jgi:hypothetical protein
MCVLFCVSQDMYLHAGGPAVPMDVFPLHLFPNKDLQ